MNINVEVVEKPEKNISTNIKAKSTTDIVNLQEVQAIKKAIREHLLFIGLDRANNIRNVSVIGIGNSCEVALDSKDIIRTALLSASEKVVLVHNHPSNNLEPSSLDIQVTNVTAKILEPFNIQLLDHIIVTEDDFISMQKAKKVNKEYENDAINNMSKGLLIEENKRLKKQVDELQQKLNTQNKSLNSMEEIEI
ncbi:MAG: hypothetical protein IJE59_02750 [Clostridia bacterium]|nr:hypothetical protein [Clostridia bacterium]